MHVFIAATVALFVGLGAGTFWGQQLERKASARILAQFSRVDAEARSAVNRLFQSFPTLKKYL